MHTSAVPRFLISVSTASQHSAQVGMLALESEADPALSRPYPLDLLGAQTHRMIGVPHRPPIRPRVPAAR
jgi:carbamate kinase